MQTQRDYNQTWYKKNKEKETARVQARQKSLRDYVQDYKLERGCSVCGYRRCGAALDLHHATGEKKLGVSNLIQRCPSPEKLQVELDKCVVLCANCHRELHAVVV